jgi:hypothetical protein
VIGALDDLQPPLSGLGEMRCRDLSLVAAIGKDHLDERKQRPGPLVRHQGGPVAVLDAGVVDSDVYQEA